MSTQYPTFSDGRYQIKAKLGSGGMAAVFLTWDTRLHVHRAIKCLDPNLSIHAEIRDRFEAEARTMASLNDPNVVAVLDIGNVGSRFFIIMDLLTGGSLWDRVKRHGVLHPQYAIDAAIAIAKGLRAAHKLNIVHRDIKPHNVLISEDGELKVTDFGIARIDDGNNTKTGVIKGTIKYMVPEQRLSASKATELSDLYAVGVSLFAIITGSSNDSLFNEEEQQRAFVNLEAPIATFLQKACHQDPSQRHRNAEEMIADLKHLKTQIKSAPSNTPPLFIPIENSFFEQDPSPKEMKELHTSWSQYGSEETENDDSDSQTYSELAGLFDSTNSGSELRDVQEEPYDSAQLTESTTPLVPTTSAKTPSTTLILAAAMVLISAFYFLGNQPSNEKSTTQVVDVEEATATDDSTNPSTSEAFSLSTIAVVPFTTRSDNNKIHSLALGILEDVSSGLSKSVTKLSVMPLREAPKDLSQEVRRVGAGYIIDGNVQNADNTVRVNIKLLKSERMSIVWSKTFERDISTSNLFTIQDEIVNEIVDALVGNGFIMQEDVQKSAQTKRAKDLSVYECRNFAYRFYKTYLPNDYQKVNECLRESIKVDPEYAELYFHLAHISFVAWQMGYNTDNDIILEALAFADKCIALEPSNPKGYFGKGLLSFVFKDWEAMHSFFKKAVEMAPNDVEILSNAGLLGITGGECSLEEYRDKKGKNSSYTTGDCRWKPGLELLQKAFKLDRGNLYPVKNYGIAHMYNLWGEYENAYNQMQLAVSPGFIWYEMHSAIAAAGMDNKNLARKHFEAVKTIVGSNRLTDAKRHFERFHVLQYWDMGKPFFVEYGFE